MESLQKSLEEEYVRMEYEHAEMGCWTHVPIMENLTGLINEFEESESLTAMYEGYIYVNLVNLVNEMTIEDSEGNRYSHDYAMRKVKDIIVGHRIWTSE